MTSPSVSQEIFNSRVQVCNPSQKVTRTISPDDLLDLEGFLPGGGTHGMQGKREFGIAQDFTVEV